MAVDPNTEAYQAQVDALSGAQPDAVTTPANTELSPELASYIRNAIAQAALGVQPGPGAVATEPGHPGDVAAKQAAESGAIASFDTLTTPNADGTGGTVNKAYLYPDGTVRLG